MPIRITCPACSATLSVKDEFAGRSVKCPKCGGIIPPAEAPPTASEPEAVATLPPPPPPAVPPPPPPPPPAAAPLELDDDEPPPARPAPPPAALPPTALPAPVAARSPFENLDEPEKPARGSRSARSRDDDDDDDRPRKKRRDDDDEDDRPRARKRRDDDDDDRPSRGRKPQGKSNGGMIVGIIAGVLLLCCGGGIGLSYYIYSKVREKVEEIAENIDKMNLLVNKPNYEKLVVGTTTRSQAEVTLGKGRMATADDLSKIFGSDKSSIASWTAVMNRTVVWQNGDDYVLALFHPGSDGDSRLQMKSWKPKTPPGASVGSSDDIAFLAKYPPTGKGDDLSGPSVAATGEEISQAYKDNKAAADTKYKDKVVVIEGAIYDFDMTPDGLQVRLNGAGPAGAGGIVPRISVQPSELKPVLNCSRVQTIKFKGRCTGLNGPFVDIMNAKVEGRPGPDPAADLGVTALVTAYANDEAEADRKYKDKQLTVSGGEVESKTADAVYLISRKSKGLRIKLTMSPDFRKQFDSIPVGRAVKVKGECGGKLGDEIYLNRGWLCP